MRWHVSGTNKIGYVELHEGADEGGVGFNIVL